jgi:tRNA (guanine-N7-)-methyltransferase
MGAAEAGPPRQPRRQIHGRRQGPKLRPGLRRLIEERLPALGISIESAGAAPLDPLALFAGSPRAVWLEVGFGGGEHLAAQAAAHPDVGFLGVEPFLNGVAKLLRAVEEQALPNVRVLMDDARLLLKVLADASVERAFVLFPDPWPKLRHHKRRIVNPETAADLARAIRPGGELRLATDDPDYARWMLAALLAEPRFDWLAERAADWREPPPGWVPTRYEAKARAAGRRPVFLRFARRELTPPPASPA